MSDFFHSKIKAPLIFFGIVLFVIILSVLIILPLRNITNSTLKKTVSNFIQKNYENNYVLTNNLTVNQTGNENQFYVWQAKEKNNNFSKEEKYIVITRVTTICGPNTLVYLYDGKKNICDCLGILGVKDYKNFEKYGITKIVLQHWDLFISELIEGYENGEK